MAFKGVYQFTKSSKFRYDKHLYPEIVGGCILRYWTQIQSTNSATYDWSSFDTYIANWAAQGKKCILRLSLGGLDWDSNAVDATPQWVYSDATYTSGIAYPNPMPGDYTGIPFVYEVPTDVYQNPSNFSASHLPQFPHGARMPKYWDSRFESKAQTLINAFGAKYDGDSRIAFIEIAIGCGGESLVDQATNPNSSGNPTNHAYTWNFSNNTPTDTGLTVLQYRLNLWNSIGYTSDTGSVDSAWWVHIVHMINFYKAAFVKTPLAVLVDLAPFLGNVASNGQSSSTSTLISGDPNYTTYHSYSGNYDRKLELRWSDDQSLANQLNKLTNTQTLNDYWYFHNANSSPFLIAEQYNAAVKNGRTLLGDLQQGINVPTPFPPNPNTSVSPLGATYALIYGDDMDDAYKSVDGLTPTSTSAASLSALQWANAQIPSPAPPILGAHGQGQDGKIVSTGKDGIVISAKDGAVISAKDGGIFSYRDGMEE